MFWLINTVGHFYLSCLLQQIAFIQLVVDLVGFWCSQVGIEFWHPAVFLPLVSSIVLGFMQLVFGWPSLYSWFIILWLFNVFGYLCFHIVNSLRFYTVSFSYSCFFIWLGFCIVRGLCLGFTQLFFTQLFLLQLVFYSAGFCTFGFNKVGFYKLFYNAGLIQLGLI